MRSPLLAALCVAVVACSGETEDSQGVVRLYEHCDYGGWEVSLAAGDYTSAKLAARGAPSADASSLRIAPGYEAVLYEMDDFQGRSVTIAGNADCLVSASFNDRAVSVRIRPSGSGSGGGNAGGNTGTGGSGTFDGDPHQACVDRINDFRATSGLPPLTRNVDAEACADGQAKSDSESGDAHGTFGNCGEMAQNECPGWDSVEDVLQNCLQSMWDEGPGGGHHDNMATDGTQAWCGFYTTPDGDVWSVQDFK